MNPPACSRVDAAHFVRTASLSRNAGAEKQHEGGRTRLRATPGDRSGGGHTESLAWTFTEPVLALSSAAVGGGLSEPAWVLNIGVDEGYTRTDLAAHAAEVAAQAGLDPSAPGCAMFTAADVTQVQHATSAGVRAWATVGVTKPTWPVPPVQTEAHHTAPGPGTVNIVLALPLPLSDAALVQAVGTITEAKAQVFTQAGVPGTGTASDAVVVVCPRASRASWVARCREGAPCGAAVVAFAGVRAPWGQHVARAVHAAVSAGLGARPWPPHGIDPEEVW